MFIEEARLVESMLATLDLPEAAAVLDIGSSDLHHRTVVQPHIDRHLHEPLRQRGAIITYLDLKNKPGVDVVLDLSDPQLPDSVFDRQYDLIICCNILEHVADRDVFVRNLFRFAADGTYLMLTVPRSYPKHDDPIDTMYRPSIRDLTDFVLGHRACSVLTARELAIADKSYYRFKAGRRLKKLTLFRLRRLLRWYIKPLRWKVTCALFAVQS
jgi:SAM-dependent methyltransferase